MTVVLLHGNPECDALWQPLIAELGRDDVICLSPPGFGSPVPDGFGATVAEYRDWLIAELESFGEPVHLVGHDWGGGHVVNVAMKRPDLLRSWAADVVGVFDPDYTWHELARIWQTPGKGEEVVAAMMGGTVADRTRNMTGLGIPHDAAETFAAVQGEEMGRCILALYRSAAQPAMSELGRDLPAAAARPGLSIVPADDPYAADMLELQRRTATRAGARTEVLDGLGHWWMLQDPARGAEVLDRFITEVSA